MDKGDFEIRDGSFLGPVELKAGLSQPRALKPDGTPVLEFMLSSRKTKAN